MPFDFVQVDAFTTRPLYGNPAAVVFDADDLPAEIMQKKTAREMNLSETVFVLKPTSAAADYRVRIFTPMSELPFAGHPTVAAAHAVLALSGQGRCRVATAGVRHRHGAGGGDAHAARQAADHDAGGAVVSGRRPGARRGGRDAGKRRSRPGAASLRSRVDRRAMVDCRGSRRYRPSIPTRA